MIDFYWLYLKKRLYTPAWMKHSDMVRAIHSVLQQLSIQVHFKEVDGHKDNSTPQMLLAIEEFLNVQEWHVEAIKEGIAAAERGDVKSHEQAIAILNTWGKSA